MRSDIYAAVVDDVAGKVPVIVLWKGGAKSLLAKITGVGVVEAPSGAASTPNFSVGMAGTLEQQGIEPV